MGFECYDLTLLSNYTPVNYVHLHKPMRNSRFPNNCGRCTRFDSFEG